MSLFVASCKSVGMGIPAVLALVLTTTLLYEVGGQVMICKEAWSL